MLAQLNLNELLSALKAGAPDATHSPFPTSTISLGENSFSFGRSAFNVAL